MIPKQALDDYSWLAACYTISNGFVWTLNESVNAAFCTSDTHIERLPYENFPANKIIFIYGQKV